MAERPLLILPEPGVVARSNKGGGAKDLHFPSGARQVSRIEPRITELEQALAARRVELRQSPMGIEPEQVLIFETIGRVDDFFKALKGIEGLEWLGDFDTEDIAQEDEDFYETDPANGQTLAGRVYWVMSNQRGLEQLRSFWETFKQNPDAPQFQYGYTKWKHLFKQLKDIRPWGPKDRLYETGLDRDWQERVSLGEETVRVEVELWFRSDSAIRLRNASVVTEFVKASSGEVIGQACIPDISYHALLARLPIVSVENILALSQTSLVFCDQVMFLRPVGQATVSVPDPAEDMPSVLAPNTVPENTPVVAVLDGMPLENHQLLTGRLVVDDPDDWSSTYEAAERIHGTSMTSLVVHGDLDGAHRSLSRPVYVRPIMKPDPYDWTRPRREAVPEDVLPVDLVHRAVRRMLEGEGEIGPVAPDVKVINLSVCDGGRPFDTNLSPWARLIDYLSWRYKVLFVISAGNYADNVELPIPRNEWHSARNDRDKLEAETVKAVLSASRNRRLFSPAESMNALTVAAVHSDSSSSQLPPNLVDLFTGSSMPSPVNAQGLGFRRSVKPDILFAGGRQVYREKIGVGGTNVVLEVPRLKRAPGNRTASPGLAGELDATSYSRGTSNAAALVSHTAGELYDVLAALSGEPGGRMLDSRLYAPVLKAMIVHGATWGKAEERLRQLVSNISDDNLTRLLGYGEVDVGRLFECTPERVTLIGCGVLGEEQAHRFELPLPPTLSGKTVWRRLTITLAWLSPANPRHRNYRIADLWFTPYGADKEDASAGNLLRVDRTEADWQTVRRGTLQHEIFEGSSATSYVDGQVLKIQVNCRADAGPVVEDVPYGLVASLEVASGVSVPVYAEVRDRVRARVLARIALASGAGESPET